MVDHPERGSLASATVSAARTTSRTLDRLAERPRHVARGADRDADRGDPGSRPHRHPQRLGLLPGRRPDRQHHDGLAARPAPAPSDGGGLRLAARPGPDHVGHRSDVRPGAAGARGPRRPRPRPARTPLRLPDRLPYRRSPHRLLGGAALGDRPVRRDPALRSALPREVDRPVPAAGARAHRDAGLPVDGRRPRRSAVRRPVSLAGPRPRCRPRRVARRRRRRLEAPELPVRDRSSARLPGRTALARGRRLRDRDHPEPPHPRVLEGTRPRLRPGPDARAGAARGGQRRGGRRRPEPRPLHRPRLSSTGDSRWTSSGSSS